MFRRRGAMPLGLAVAGAMLATVLSVAIPTAQAASTGLVISQVYGGGGNSGALFTHDFIELFNRGTDSISLNNLSLQYASATGTGNFGSSATQLTELPNVTLQPGQYFLVQQVGGTTGAAMPTPDFVDPTPIALSATAGKVALVSGSSSLGCNGGSAVCSADQLSRIIDLVGFGSANFYEGSAAAPAPSNTNAVLRAGNGCTDTDINSADFTAASATPRTTASALNSCSPTSTPTPSPSSAPTPSPAPVPATLIREIQGAAHTSPLVNQTVAGVSGIVTALRSNGFYMQDPQPDTNDATSEAIFVFTSSAPTVRVGDSVLISGRVGEFRPGGSGGTNNLTTTQLSSPTISVQSSGNALPSATVIGAGGRVPPTAIIEDDVTGSVESGGVFDPATDGIDFYESMEAMLVQVNNAVAVGPTSDFGEIPVLADNGAGATVRTTRGGIVIRPNDFNPERIIVDDVIVDKEPQVNVGATFTTPIIGVIDYSFSNFKLLNTNTLEIAANPLQREATTLTATPDQLTIANFNVENLSPADGAAKIDALAAAVVTNLKTPDIVVLEEVQDNNGPVNDSVVDANLTYQALIDAIAKANGPTYEYRQVNPVDDQDGGQPGGNIRVGFLFNPARVEFVDRGEADSTTATGVIDNGGTPQLQYSPGRIDPTNSAFNNSRKPLVGEFAFNGNPVFVIANHFNSKGGDQPLFGRFQPPTRSSEEQRQQQAQIVAEFVQDILAIDRAANVVVTGDLNDFEFSPTVTLLENAGLTALIETLPEAERYTYVFEGNSQVLDHIMVSDNLLAAAKAEFDVVHFNAEFADQISDHDPSVARFTLRNVAPTATFTAPSSVIKGATFELALINPFDPSTGSAGAPFTYAFDCGIGTGYSAFGASNTATCGADIVGSRTVRAQIRDNAGAVTEYSATVSVVYNFSGFFAPIDNGGIVNTIKAGRAVPVKFSLGGNQGLNVFAAGYPKVQFVACGNGSPTDAVEETLTAGNSSLAYNSATDTYTYVWKTEKGWTGKCGQLQVKFNDGTTQTANFRFR